MGRLACSKETLSCYQEPRSSFRLSIAQFLQESHNAPFTFITRTSTEVRRCISAKKLAKGIPSFKREAETATTRRPSSPDKGARGLRVYTRGDYPSDATRHDAVRRDAAAADDDNEDEHASAAREIKAFSSPRIITLPLAATPHVVVIRVSADKQTNKGLRERRERERRSKRPALPRFSLFAFRVSLLFPRRLRSAAQIK